MRRWVLFVVHMVEEGISDVGVGGPGVRGVEHFAKVGGACPVNAAGIAPDRFVWAVFGVQIAVRVLSEVPRRDERWGQTKCASRV